MHKPTEHLLKAVLLAAGLLAAIPPVHAEEETVVILAADGTRTELALGSVLSIDLNADGLSVATHTDQVISYAYDEIDRILMPGASVGIDVVPGQGELAIWPSPVTDILNIAGASGTAPVSVFDTDGRKVAGTVCHDGRATLSLGSLPPSVYIVTVGDRSTKIIKK